MERKLRVAGLFAGIGGFEKGLEASGHDAVLFCELDDDASAVLRTRFARAARHLVPDVRSLEELPDDVELLVGGFPCQDLSQAGETRGIHGAESGLIKEVLRLLERRAIDWLLLENVPFMLQLHRGDAMRFILDRLEELGYRWAYRVIDTRAFGLPQRRRRVFLLATRLTSESPEEMLLADLGRAWVEPREPDGEPCGFYWTEGLRGIGWAVNAVPTLKGGSGVGIPSPPGVWLPDAGRGFRIVTPTIEQVEALQGFDRGWTDTLDPRRERYRWKLVGNAVSVPVAEWLGQLLTDYSRTTTLPLHSPLCTSGTLPTAAFGSAEGRFVAHEVSEWPNTGRSFDLGEFLASNPGELKPLSVRATEGFLARLQRGSLWRPAAFEADLSEHLRVASSSSIAIHASSEVAVT